MNLPDYKAAFRVECLISEDTDFTKGEIYECFSISSKGNAKVIDNHREENYLLFGDYQVIEDFENELPRKDWYLKL